MATAADTKGLIGVRADLNSRGIDNSRIGFNKDTGYVTVDGQNFIQPKSVVGGVSYADPTAFSQSFDILDTGQKAKTAEDNYMSAVSTPKVNPFDQQLTDYFAKISGMIDNPAPYDVYSDPAYGAFKAQADRGAQRSIRAAQESMGASGFGRSTPLADRAQGIQNESNEYLETQVIPQLRAANQAEQQQKLASLFNFVNALAGQQGVFDTRATAETNQLADVLDFLTGRSDRAQDVKYRSDQDTYNRGRDAIADERYADETAYARGRDVVADKRYEDEIAYRDARDKIADERYKLEFDENVRQWGLDYALRKAATDNQIANSNADNARANAAAARSAQNDRIANLYEVWDRTGFAPAGIPNVKEGTPIVGKNSSSGLTLADMQSEASEMLGMLRSGQITPEQALQQIGDDESVGIYSKENANYLRSQIERVAPSVVSTRPVSPKQQEALKSLPSDKEIDRQWEKEGKSKGYGMIDYRSWYKSPQGRSAGNSFEQWKKLYGPRLTTN